MPEAQASDEQIQRHEMEKLKDTLEITVQLISLTNESTQRQIQWRKLPESTQCIADWTPESRSSCSKPHSPYATAHKWKMLPQEKSSSDEGKEWTNIWMKDKHLIEARSSQGPK